MTAPFGPMSAQVEEMIAAARSLTADQVAKLAAFGPRSEDRSSAGISVSYAAETAGREIDVRAARGATWQAAYAASGTSSLVAAENVGDAARALAIADLIGIEYPLGESPDGEVVVGAYTQQDYDLLLEPWRAAVGPEPTLIGSAE